MNKDIGVMKEPIIWYNKLFKVGIEVMFNKVFYENGIYIVAHLFGENNKFLTCDAFAQEYNMKAHFLSYLGIIDVIKETNTDQDDKTNHKHVIIPPLTRNVAFFFKFKKGAKTCIIIIKCKI